MAEVAVPLWEIVELLKRELNLKGNSADVVAESSREGAKRRSEGGGARAARRPGAARPL